MLAEASVLPVAKPRLYLHLGVHKTATTSLQVLIEHNAVGLAAQGVLPLPRKSETFAALHGDAGQTWNYRGDFKLPLRKLARSRGRRKKYRRLLACSMPKLAPFRTTRNDLLISDEDLLGRPFGEERRLYPDAERHIKVLQDVFPNHEMKVILYLREQPSFLESCYVQKVHRGLGGSFAEYLRGVDLEHLDWFSLAARVGGVVGPNNLSVRPFSSINEGFPAFAAEFFQHFSDPSKLDLYAVHTNPSLSGLGIAVARGLASLLPRDYWRKVRPLLQRALSSRFLPRARLMDDDQYHSLAARYADDIAKTVRSYPGAPGDFSIRRFDPSELKAPIEHE